MGQVGGTIVQLVSLDAKFQNNQCYYAYGPLDVDARSVMVFARPRAVSSKVPKVERRRSW